MVAAVAIGAGTSDLGIMRWLTGRACTCRLRADGAWLRLLTGRFESSWKNCRRRLPFGHSRPPEEIAETKVIMRHKRAHFDVSQRPMLLAVAGNTPLNFVGLSRHHRFFAHVDIAA